VTRQTLNDYALFLGILFLGILGTLIAPPLLSAAGEAVSIDGKNIRVEFNSKMHSRIVAKFDGKETVLGDFGPSEFVMAGGAAVQDFNLTGHKVQNVREELGRGRQLSLTGVSGALQKTVVVTVYDEIPRMAFFETQVIRLSGRTRAARTRIVQTGFCL
jgi:alpha-galactosidase